MDLQSNSWNKENSLAKVLDTIKLQAWKGSHMPTKTSWKKNVNNLIHASSKNTLCISLCLTLCNPMDQSPPGSSVHGIFQARILE